MTSFPSSKILEAPQKEYIRRQLEATTYFILIQFQSENTREKKNNKHKNKHKNQTGSLEPFGTGAKSHIYLNRPKAITKSQPSTELNDGLSSRV